MKRLASRLTLALLCGLGCWPAPAQEFRSTLSGVVRDIQGSVVPGVAVHAKNADTGADVSTVTGEAGQFTLPFLPPGRYTITSEVTGFKKYSQSDVVITANQRVSLDIALELGDVSETMTVTGSASLLATGTASVGQSVVADQIADLPMAGRAPMVLARLSFGVVDLANPAYNTRPFDTSGTSTYSIGGGRSSANEILLDGTPNEGSYRVVAYNAPIDAVQETKTEVFQSDAAYGNTSGGTINVITKGGTNQFHGTLGFYNQTSELAANLFFSNKAGIKRPVSRYNQWGGSIGGPVIIPHVFNGTNKLFWFFDYDAISDFRPVGTSPTLTVPTPAMGKGDFSGLLPFGAAYQLYDPYSAVAQGSRRQRQPLANNILPPSELSPIAKNYLPYYPLPNVPGILGGQQNNYQASQADTDAYWNYLGRMDINFGDKHKVYFNGHSNWRRDNINQVLPGPTTGVERYRTGSGAYVDDVYGFSPTMWLNTRLSYSRFNDPDVPRSNGFDITSLGFPAYMKTNSIQPQMPGVTFTDGTQTLGGQAGYTDPFDTTALFVAVTRSTGQHTLKFGGDLRRMRENAVVFGSPAGTFSFGQSSSGQNWLGQFDNSTAAPYGFGMASFMLGLPVGGGYDINAYTSYKSYYGAVFVQDDWRPTSNLTLNIGLRWEKESAATERYNRSLAGFDFTTPNALTAAAKAAYAASPVPQLPVSQFNPVGGPLFVGSSHPSIYSTPSHAFSPRLGLAYKPDMLGGHTVIRAGLGMFFQPYGTLPFGQLPNAAGVSPVGFSQNTPFVASNDGYLTPYATLSNPFPGGIAQPAGVANGLNTNLGKTMSFINPTLDDPYLIRWTFSMQRELAPNLVAEFGYVGSHGLHLAFDRDINFIPAGALSTSPTRDQQTINTLTANVANPFQGLLPNTNLNGSTVALSQLLRPFPQYYGDGSLTDQSQNLGYSIYNLLDARIEKRLSNGFQVLVSYSFSKMISAVSMLNPADVQPERRIASEDRPQRFVVSGGYTLPFGRGKMLLSHPRVWQNALISNWKVGGIMTIQSGGPLSWGNVIYYGGNLNLDPRNTSAAFDKTRFNTVSSQQLANNVRTFNSAFSNLRSDGPVNVDFSLSKENAIREKYRLQFRIEAFNAFNHVLFGSPTLTPTSASFGQITSQNNIPRFIQMSLRLVW